MSANNRVAGAQFLAQLFEKPEEEVEKVRKRYLGRDNAVAGARLRQVRDALDGLMCAVLRDDDEGWGLVERAVKPLRQVMGLPPDAAPASERAGMPSPSEALPATTPEPVASGGSMPSAPVLPVPPQSPLAPMSEAPASVASGAPASRSPWVAGGAPPAADPSGPSPWQAPAAVAHVAPAAASGPMTIAAAGVPVAAAATPFRPGAGAAPPPAGAPAPQPVSTGTSSLSDGHLAQHAGAPIPFAGGAPTLTVQQYAQLCALLAERPAEAAMSFAKYGLVDDAGRTAVDAEWKARLASDETSRQLFELLYERIRKQLRSGR